MAHKKGSGWCVRWRENGKLRSKTFDRKVDADKFEATLKITADAPKFTSTLTFSEFSEQWLRDYCRVHKAESQWGDDAATISRYLIPAFGKKKLLDLRLTDIVAVQSYLYREKGLKPKSVNNFTGIAKKMLEDAVGWDLIPTNPFKKLLRLRVDEREPKFWTFEERDRFLAYAREHDAELYEVVAFTVYCGLRFGEVRGLRRDCLNFQKREISVRRHFDSKVQKLFERTKGKRIRRVPMNDVVYDILFSRYADSSDAKVFKTDFHNLLNRRLKPTCKKAGVSVLVFHELRHTFASHLAMLGVPLIKIKALLGHSDIKSTMVYAHLDDNSLQGITECLAASKNVELARTGSDSRSKPTLSVVPRLFPNDAKA